MKEWQLVRKAGKYNKIIIYGAGMVGELVYRRLVVNGLEDRILGFAVSQKGTQDIYQGLTIKSISEWSNNEDILIIIATLQNFHEEIEAILRNYSFSNIVKVEDLLFRSMGKAYIKDFLAKSPQQYGQVDVVFMASDNNSSSGAFLSMADLNLELNRRGVSTIVILPVYGDGEKILTEKGVNYTYMLSEDWLIEQKVKSRGRKVWRLLQNASTVRQLCVFFSDYGVRLVHNNTTYTYIGAVAAHRAGIPVVWHLRENIWDQGYTFLSQRWAVRLLNRSERLIFISQYMKSCIQGLNYNIMKTIYNGVDTDAFYREHKILHSLPTVTLVLIGKVAEYKGQQDIIEAAAIVHKKTDLQLRIELVGKEEAEYKRKLEGLIAQYDLEDIVCFSGKRDDIAHCYEMADIAVMCSVAEPFGRVTVEAQLSGCLVIGANSGATPELIRHGKTGLIYEKGRIQDLAEQIIWATEHPEEANEIARSGQENAYKQYSKERNAQEVIAVYEEILGKNWNGNLMGE